MTYFMVEQLQNSQGAVTMESSYEYCKQGMKKYFEELNEAIKKNGGKPVEPTQPFMLNYADQPVLVKP